MSLFSRSYCPHCKNTLAWYDLVPVVSWLHLQGNCRSCAQAISFLYPCIELFTAIVLSLLYTALPQYFFPYAFFASALIVTIRSDVETMLISPAATLYLVPLGILASFLEFIPLSSSESLYGAFFGYFFLYSINVCYKALKQHDGVGEGDFDLLCFIGAFTGISGCWASITLGSAAGCICVLFYFMYTSLLGAHDNNEQPLVKIPFGPFLALGAIIFLFFRCEIYAFLGVA